MDCVHAFEQVNLLDWASKCHLCSKRTRFPWKKMLKCKTCRVVFRVKCATNAARTPNLERPTTVTNSTEPAVPADNRKQGSTNDIDSNTMPSMIKANGSKSDEVLETIDSSPELEAPVLDDHGQKSDVPALETNGPEPLAPAIDIEGREPLPPMASVAADSLKLDDPLSIAELEVPVAEVSDHDRDRVSEEPITSALGPKPGSPETTFPYDPRPTADGSPNAEVGCPGEAIGSGDEPLEQAEDVLRDNPNRRRGATKRLYNPKIDF